MVLRLRKPKSEVELALKALIEQGRVLFAGATSAEASSWDAVNKDELEMLFEGDEALEQYRKSGLSLIASRGGVRSMVNARLKALETLVARLGHAQETTNEAASSTEVGGPAENRADLLLTRIVDGFHRVACALRTRRTGCEPLIIQNEYDVQYLFAALLAIDFEDVRREDWTPSHAGGPARIDLVLQPHGIAIELKMMRDGLSDRHVGDQLIEDIERYRTRCTSLICFVYDPDHRLKNPVALEADLSRDQPIKVRVFVRPRR